MDESSTYALRESIGLVPGKVTLEGKKAPEKNRYDKDVSNDHCIKYKYMP